MGLKIGSKCKQRRNYTALKSPWEVMQIFKNLGKK